MPASIVPESTLGRVILAALATVCVVVLLAAIAIFFPSSTSVSLKEFGAEVLVKDDNDNRAVLDALYEKDPAFVKAWAKSKGLFPIGTGEIAEQLAQELPTVGEVAIENPMEKVTEFNKTIEAHPLIKTLRSKSDARQSPFNFFGDVMVASSPDCKRDRPPQGTMYVRKNSKYAALDGSVVEVRHGTQNLPNATLVRLQARSMPNTVDVIMNKSQRDFLGLDFPGGTGKILVVLTAIPGEDFEAASDRAGADDPRSASSSRRLCGA